jgi:hypothetical protein
MTDTPSKITLLDRVEQLQRRTNTLVNLVKLQAPALVIENSLHLVAKTIISIPRNEEAILMRESVDDSIKKDESDWLNKTGFYADIEKDLDSE